MQSSGNAKKNEKLRKVLFILTTQGARTMALTIPGVSCEMCHGLVEAVLPSQYTELVSVNQNLIKRGLTFITLIN